MLIGQHLNQVNDSDDIGRNKTDDSEDDIMAAVHNTNVKRGNVNRDRLYGDCSFILGSAAEVERLWSYAKHMLTNERKGMMEADNFEALLFLKMNKHLWDSIDLAEADKARQREVSAARLGDAEEVTSSSDGESSGVE